MCSSGVGSAVADEGGCYRARESGLGPDVALRAEIIPAGQLGNPAIPQGFSKFATDTFASPSGPFQAHIYMNPVTGEVYYGLDYKIIFTGP